MTARMLTGALVAVVVLNPATGLDAQQLPTAIPQTKFASGQNVVPYFEGWIRNTDGSFDLVFGYFNRNWEETIVLQPGPQNQISPGAVDQGQPTVFLPRRQGWVYRVRVPRDFGKQVVTWTITVNGKTEKAYGELMPVEEITERIVITRGNLNPGDGDPNKPPAVTIEVVKDATVSRPIRIVARVLDDGLPKPRAAVQRTRASDATQIQQQTNTSGTGQRRGLVVSWMQLRGPAKAAVEGANPTAPADGTASVVARFDQPGTYVLRATANDGALATTSDVTIVVEGTKPL
ncbi:MAG TPA: hypothetical protein VF219_21930 [Vicinamibacterales bacterium]